MSVGWLQAVLATRLRRNSCVSIGASTATGKQKSCFPARIMPSKLSKSAFFLSHACSSAASQSFARLRPRRVACIDKAAFDNFLAWLRFSRSKRAFAARAALSLFPFGFGMLPNIWF
jgi:hypothetical protein